MLTNSVVLLLIVILYQAFGLPQKYYTKRSAVNQRIASDLQPIILQSVQVPAIFAPILHPHSVAILKTNVRKKKGPNIPLSLPIPHQLLVPTKLHVIPARSNVHQSSVHTDIKHLVTKDNIKIPVISQTISHTAANITHATPLVPVVIPLHDHIVPVEDLSVIPLQPIDKVEPKISQLKSADKNDDRDEPTRYRAFGGFGNGLYFGGHGAGHGFYSFPGYHG